MKIKVQGRRKRGRPKRRWLDKVKDDIKEKGLSADKVQGRRKRGRPKRRRLDKVKDDIKEKELSADEVYDRATWRRTSSYIDHT